ncbi:hypothetical protein [Frigidibacter sp. ROC022]|uniref:hypothetical protein n=1 Tax=Frigidibacter sp. ROC022 TaxID=2971796 RepID=UPI00215B1D49|nr:hypothetical protein [Frigidibacter sp. ROC022]MCR8725061.1 hypothetical protein [Frigidibacter sp. ROC022]
MDLETAKAIIESRVVQKYLEQVDTDAEAALDTLDANVKLLKTYPPAMVSQYKKDGTALDKAWGVFNQEVNSITFGKARDGKAAMAAYSKYILTLEVLEAQNVRYSAYIGAKVAELVAALLKLVIEITKKMREKFKELLVELKALEALLKKAKKDVKGAEAQRIINVGITAVSLCIPAVGLGAGIAIAVGTFTVQTIIDSQLGPGSPGAMGSLNNAVGDTIGLPKQVKPKFAKLGGAATGLIALKMDSDEVADAKRIVTEVQKRMKKVQALLKTLDGFLSKDVGFIEKAEMAMLKAMDAAERGAKLYRSQAQVRKGLLKELAKIK